MASIACFCSRNYKTAKTLVESLVNKLSIEELFLFSMVLVSHQFIWIILLSKTFLFENSVVPCRLLSRYKDKGENRYEPRHVISNNVDL